MFKKILHIIKNKYVIVTSAFFVWILVFDKSNLLSQIDLAQKLHKLQEEKLYYKQEIKKDSVEIRELLNNPESLEKFARERYLMKRDSEDIFLIVHNDTLPKAEK